MNNHQNTIFHQFGNFLKTPLALLGVDLKNAHVNKTCHFVNHLYLCKGLMIYKYDKKIPLEKQCRVEIQIRTRLQHSWATAVEVTGTYLDQPLKQSFGDKKYLDIFKEISKLFISLEKRNIDYEFVKKIKQNIENIKLLEELRSFNIVSRYLINNAKGKYLLLKMDFKQKIVEIS